MAGRILVACLLACAVACQGGVDSQMAEIRTLQDGGQFDPSIAPLRRVLASDSNHPEANYRLGIALVQTGRPSLAVWPLQKAGDSDEFAIPAGLLLATTLMQNGTYEESIRAATRVLEREPDNVTALLTRGHAQLSAGHPEATLADADAALALKPDDQSATSLRGGALVDLNRVDEAEATWRNIYETAKAGDDLNSAARTCAALGTFFRSQKDDVKAAEIFEMCIAEYPNHPLLQQWGSDFFISIGNQERAIDVWRAAVATSPEDLTLRSKLADLLVDDAHRAEGEALLKETTTLFDTPQSWRMLASFYRKVGEPSKARVALEEAMDRSANVSTPLQFALADMLIDEGELERAEEVAAGIQEPSYRNLLEGSILLKRNEPEAALAKLETGLRLWPNNAGARYLAGIAALELKDSERAIREFREAVRVGETETDASLRLAELYFIKGDFTSALQFAQKQIQKRPFGDGTAHVIAARSAIKIGNPAMAENMLQNLKVRAPESVQPYVEFVAIKRERDGLPAAIEMLEEAPIDLNDPKNIEGLRALVELYVENGDPAKALARVEAAAKAHPESAEQVDLYARVLMTAGRFDDAKKRFEAILAADGTNASASAGLAELARAKSDFDGALRHYERAIASDPEVAEYRYAAAQLQLRKGNVDAAIEQLSAGEASDPTNLGISNDLAFLLAQRGDDLDRALILAQRSVRLNMNGDTLDTLGFVHLKRGENEQAVSVLDKAHEANPDSASIAYRLGVALAAAGEKERAREILTQALGGPAFPEADDARAELARLQES